MVLQRSEVGDHFVSLGFPTLAIPEYQTTCRFILPPSASASSRTMTVSLPVVETVQVNLKLHPPSSEEGVY